jgi:hypothetical protein
MRASDVGKFVAAWLFVAFVGLGVVGFVWVVFTMVTKYNSWAAMSFIATVMVFTVSILLYGLMGEENV